MLRFYTHHFAKMWTELLVSLAVDLILVLAYYFISGTPPGARVIVQELPVDSGLEDNQATFMFFYTTWCPHCKNAETPWHSFKQLLKNRNSTFGGKSVTFEEINGDVDKGKKALYDIKAYPTFKVITKDKVFEMVGKPNTDNFKSFLEKTLGSEKTV